MGGPTWTDLPAKQVMNRVTAPGMPFRYSINPYRGCAHGCAFCYARSTHAYVGLGVDDSFQNQIFIKQNAADALERQLERMAKRHGWNLESLAADIGHLAIGTATDPYQPAEARTRITRSCLEVLARYQVPVSITTRSPLVLRDIDLLTRMNILSVNLSVNTLDRTVWRAFEPTSPAPLKRLEAVKELRHHGLQAGVFLAPILPGLTDVTRDLDGVFAAAADAKAAFVMASILRLTPDVKAWYLQAVERFAPELLPTYRRLYRQAYPPRGYVDGVMRRIDTLLARHRLQHMSETQLQHSTRRRLAPLAASSTALHGSVQLLLTLDD